MGRAKLFLCWISSIEVVEDVAAYNHILSNYEFNPLRKLYRTLE
jgi:hypothetical protein